KCIVANILSVQIFQTVVALVFLFLRGYGNRRNGVTTNAVTEQVDMAALQRRKQRCSDDWETPDSWLL
ncbi:hypothetical protein, partial [Prevotella nigrescens]|uniref:hypothetical protein n=1 Tax=Prevotella nigrescens TaxID=28133 RepID=UPI00361AAC70